MSLACGHPAGLALTGAGALFTLGLGGGLHCLGMCGPLSCVLIQPSGKPAKALAFYQAARALSYASLGVVMWQLGAPLRMGLSWPWLAMLAACPLLAYSLFPSFEWPSWLAPLQREVHGRVRSLAPQWRGIALGLASPLLPCGLLYAAAGFCLAAPGPWEAALWMLAFALGSLPLLMVGQLGWRWLEAGNRPFLGGLRRGLAVVAAAGILFFAFLES